MKAVFCVFGAFLDRVGGGLEVTDFSVLSTHSALVNTTVTGPACKDILGLFMHCLLRFTYNRFILLNKVNYKYLGVTRDGRGSNLSSDRRASQTPFGLCRITNEMWSGAHSHSDRDQCATHLYHFHLKQTMAIRSSKKKPNQVKRTSPAIL